MNENDAKRRRFKVTVDGNDYIVEIEELPYMDVVGSDVSSNTRDTTVDVNNDEKPTVSDSDLLA